ncbi:TonB-dependent receptor [bacterium]|nr:TonB-dependent receptor [bacterium]
MKIRNAVSIGTILILSLQAGLFAQTTGKISGTVLDAEDGGALMGANVIIEGTQLGAAAGTDGSFYILNIPPGTYDLRIRMMGYKDYLLTNLRVSVNRTSEVNIQMESTVMKGDVVVVTADRLAVKKDQTGSIRNVSAEEIAVLPVESASDVIQLQAGVVDGHFRGGRLTEVSYLVDGMKVDDTFGGEGRVVDVETEAIQDLEVITGTFNAEYGQAMSGVVNVVTKDGGNAFHGSVSGAMAGYVTKRDHIFIGLPDDNFKSFWGNLPEYARQNDIKIQLDGPIIKDRLTFFVNYRNEDNDNYLNGIRRFNVTDYSDYESPYQQGWFTMDTGDSAYVPLDYSKNQSLMGKLTLKGKQAKLSLSYTRDLNEWMAYNDNDMDGASGSGYQFKYNPDGKTSKHRETDMIAAQLNHMFAKNAFYELKAYVKQSTYGHYLFEKPGDSGYEPFIYLANQNHTGFYTGGQGRNHDTNDSDDFNLKFDLTWQADRHHSLKTGIVYTDIRFSIADAQIIDLNPEADFSPGLPDDSTAFADIYTQEPMELSAYIQDKMEFNEMVINAGLRFDYYDLNTTHPSNWRNPANTDRSESSRLSDELETKPEYQISPRLGLSYQLGKTAVLHFSYGHFFQMPPYYALYSNHSRTIQTDGNTRLGNPTLKAEKTISYEIGLWQEIANDMSVEVALFYRDIYDLLTVNVVETYYAVRYGLYGNIDYANSRGLELKYDMRHQNFTANLNYTLQYTRGNSDNPSTTFDRAGENQDPIPYLVPMSWDQRHTLNLSMGYNTRRYGATLTAKYGSGRPYTYEPVAQSVMSRVNLYINNDLRPPTFTLDLRSFYEIPLKGNYRLRFMLSVYNLLDRLNTNWVESSTGQAYTRILLPGDYNSHKSDFNTVYDRVQNPSAYYAPRLVKLGMGIFF